MTYAKHLHGTSKTDAVKSSFENKIKHMERVYRSWKKAGTRDDQFWPTSLRELRLWEHPDAGIYSWTSPNVTLRNGRYKKLIERYWKLQDGAARLPSGQEPESSETQRLKKEVVKLAQQVSTLTWQIMDYRDEIIRIDPNNKMLQRIEFP